MKVTVKVFQGEECSLEVTDRTSVKDLKQYVSETLKVPVNQQKLLLNGRPLSDEKFMADYPLIIEGTKINLIVKKYNTEEESALRSAVVKFLRPKYTESDTQRVADEFMKDFNRSMGTLNLEDIERLALSFMEEDKGS